MSVLRCRDLGPGELQAPLSRYGLELVIVADDSAIPGSYWGEPEAGLVRHRLFARSDTPVHSVLHEASHYVCMTPERRAGLDTDAGGGYDEENGVCYLQILLADQVRDVGRDRMFSDMDAWGYTFRLGSARRWFLKDADDARQWLEDRDLVNAGLPAWDLRGEGPERIRRTFAGGNPR